MGKHSKKSKNKHKHKSKHSKDDRKSSSSKRGIEINNPREGNSLVELTAEAVAKAPLIFDNFPPVIAELDRGAAVSLSIIEDKASREAIASILKKMQVAEFDSKTQTWSRVSANIKLNKIISSEFLVQSHSQLISQTSQSLSPAIALALTMFFPDVLSELPPILEQLRADTKIDISGLANPSLRQGLQVLLDSLEGYRKSVKVLYKILQVYGQQGGGRRVVFTDDDKKKEDKRTSSKKKKGKDKDSSDGEDDGQSTSSSSSSSSREHDAPQPVTVDSELPADNHITGGSEENGDGEDDDGPAPARIGPQLPPPGDWMPSTRGVGAEDSDTDSDDEGAGPQPHFGPQGPSMQPRPSVLLGTLGLTLYDEVAAGEEGKSSAEQVTAQKREEWILDPGNSQALRAMGGGDTSLFLSNRKFDAGKGAKKRAEQMRIRSNLIQEVVAKEAGAVEGAGTSMDATVEEAPAAPSLLAEHLAKKARKGDDHRTEGIRRPFDRDKDVLGGKKLTQEDLLRLADNAKDLHSKFDKGGVQRSFL